MPKVKARLLMTYPLQMKLLAMTQLAESCVCHAVTIHHPRLLLPLPSSHPPYLTWHRVGNDTMGTQLHVSCSCHLLPLPLPSATLCCPPLPLPSSHPPHLMQHQVGADTMHRIVYVSCSHHPTLTPPTPLGAPSSWQDRMMDIPSLGYTLG